MVVMNTTRRSSIQTGLAFSLSAVGLAAQQVDRKTEPATKPIRPEPQRGAPQDLGLVKAFVGAGHGDKNLERAKELLAQDPKLIYAVLDWGGGDWETALGGASHTGSREMARYLLSKGARIDSFCAAMLGQRQVVDALVSANPLTVTAKGPHGYSLLYRRSHQRRRGNGGSAQAAASVQARPLQSGLSRRRARWASGDD